jgi:hypothetical protein
MWLFTEKGFFSVVKSRQYPTKILIRSRDRSHLAALSKHLKLTADILEHKGSDYQFRIMVDRATWVSIVAVLADDIDYTNFKDHVDRLAKRGSISHYSQLLHMVWQLVWENRPK